MQSKNVFESNFIFPTEVKKNLPEWARIEKDPIGEIITVEGNIIYPMFLKLLGFSTDKKKISLEQVELARAIMTRYLKREVVKRFGGADAATRIRITTDAKRTWRLTNFTRNFDRYNLQQVFNEIKQKGKFKALEEKTEKH